MDSATISIGLGVSVVVTAGGATTATGGAAGVTIGVTGFGGATTSTTGAGDCLLFVVEPHPERRVKVHNSNPAGTVMANGVRVFIAVFR